MPLKIEDYAMLSDTQTAALVGKDGSIDWLCLPRFDSESCFAALLGDEHNGRWKIAPRGATRSVTRRYRGDSLILETETTTDEGTVRVIDFMPPRGEAPDVVRIVEGVRGRVHVHMDLRLRFDYGRTLPWVRRVDGALVAVAGPNSVWLRTPVEVRGEDFTTYADFVISEGDQMPFTLTWNPSWKKAPKPVNPLHALRDTEQYWRRWMKKCTYDGEWREAVVRSLITLKGLTYEPTGGIVAAATTSLPEQLGGVRNWDYRFCWLRDATITLLALLYSGYESEAKAWRGWLLRAIAGDPSKTQIMYGVAGERRLPEWEVPWLAGYHNSTPVRVGNAAVDQFQLDVYGEVLDAMHQARRAGIATDRQAWALERALVAFLEQHWQEPDEGIWEMRGPRRDFVHSKVMAWVALDRAVKGVEQFGLPGDVQRWRRLRDDIHREVCAKGFDADRNTFTQYYGSSSLDASVLYIPIVGFLPGTDERVKGTVAAIERELVQDGLVMRYSTTPGGDVDGLPAGEGAFLACSFWLADNYALSGEEGKARELFDRLLALRNDVGLLSEEYDPRARRQVGNFPQAFSHLALVNSARNLSQASGGPSHVRSEAEGDQPPTLAVREESDSLTGSD